MKRPKQPRYPATAAEAAKSVRAAVRDELARPGADERWIRHWLIEAVQVIKRCHTALMARKPQAAADTVKERDRYWKAAIQARKRHAQIAHRANAARAESFANVMTDRAETCVRQHRKAQSDAQGQAFRSRLSFAAAEALDRLNLTMGRLSNPLQAEDGATVESLMRPMRKDGIIELASRYVIDIEHVRAAREIAWIVEAITSGVGASAMRIEAAGGPPKKSGRREGMVADDAALLHAFVYRPWILECKALPAQAVLDVVVGGVSVGVIAERERLHELVVEKEVAEALTRYIVKRDAFDLDHARSADDDQASQADEGAH